MDQQLLDQLGLVFVDAAITRCLKEQAVAGQETCEPAAEDCASPPATATAALREVRQ